MATLKAGDIVQLVGRDRKQQTFIFRLTAGEKFHTHYGHIEHDALMQMAICPGRTAVEAGTGSGGSTTVQAQMVGTAGRVISYDVREDMQALARRNLERVGLLERVTLKQRDIAAGFDESDVDALFLDVPNPWDYTAQARSALKGGGFFGSILPTANQVSRLLTSLERDGFSFIEVCEVLIRYY